VLDDYLSCRNAVEVLTQLGHSGTKPLVVVTYHHSPSENERETLRALGVSALINKRDHSELTEIVRHLLEPSSLRQRIAFDSIT